MDSINIIHVISWTLVISGWIILNVLANRREKRKELYALIKDIRQEIDTATDIAEKYHTSEQQSKEVSKKIKFLIQEITAWNDILQSCDLNVDLMLHIKFRQAITGHNFDSHTFTQQSHDGELLLSINRASLELKNGIMRAFSKKYY